MKKIILIFTLCLTFSMLYAQSKSISGKVLDESNEPLPGVSVKSTTIGTITDINGNFKLQVSADTKTLSLSYIGYVSQTLNLADKSFFEIKLEPNAHALDEIVAIGYGSVKKSDLTGAVGSISGSNISKRKTTQVSQALQGAVSGLMVTRNNNTPGSTATIRVRGITTIGDSNPLIILDGVPVDDINNINPNDIENVSVLKDAASASIYGSRAASGVILVTTRRAKIGEVSMDYNYEYGIEKATKLPDYVGAKRYMEMVNELRWNDAGNGTNQYPTYAKNTIEKYDSLNTANPNLYPNTNWRGLILKNSAPRQSHVVNITAGTNTVRTKISLAYDKTDALYEYRSYERLTARVNNDIKINKKLSATVDLNFKRSISNTPTIDPIYNMQITPPVYAAVWSNGLIASGKDGANVYAQLQKGGFVKNIYNTLAGKISLDYSPFKDFRLTAVISPSLGVDKLKNFRKAIPYTNYDNPDLVKGYISDYSATSLSENRNDNYRVTSQLLANYSKSFKGHNFNLMMGYETFHAFNENLGASRGNYLLDSYPYLNIGPLELRDNTGDAYENAYSSYFGRIMYNYNNKYYFQANIRRDGSSRFYKDYRWANFPSFSTGWVASEESFLKDFSALSFLKLRASWGTLGNERIGNYPYQAALNFENNSLFYQGTTVVSAQSAAQWQYAIQNISWETTESLDFGIDANFFKNKLRLTADYYNKTTKDMLLALEIPKYLGFDNPNQNTGKMNTKGWEIELGWNDKFGDFDYSVSANLSDFKSKMGDLGGTEFLGDQIKKLGSEFNEWYGYQSDGLYQTDDQVSTLPKLNATVKKGDVIYKDLSGPDGVPDGKITPDYDRVLLGGSLPRFMYGGNIQMGYKGFDFSMAFQGVGKQNARMSGYMVAPLRDNWGNIPAILDGNSWSNLNTPEQNLVAKYPRLTYNAAGNNYAMSDYWLFDGSYFRLKNITIGYNLPKSIVSKIGVQSLRLYVSGSDMLTFNHYPKGWDPEMDSFSYPITQSYLCGISVKF
ncbi:MAG: TonB-dependent receptor [Paludibacter sp.]|nr:TonB-dependent receptor [Paludibacter sp.]